MEENADDNRRGRAYQDYVQRLRHLTERLRLNELRQAPVQPRGFVLLACDRPDVNTPDR